MTVPAAIRPSSSTMMACAPAARPAETARPSSVASTVVYRRKPRPPKSASAGTPARPHGCRRAPASPAPRPARRAAAQVVGARRTRGHQRRLRRLQHVVIFQPRQPRCRRARFHAQAGRVLHHVVRKRGAAALVEADVRAGVRHASDDVRRAQRFRAIGAAQPRAGRVQEQARQRPEPPRTAVPPGVNAATRQQRVQAAPLFRQQGTGQDCVTVHQGRRDALAAFRHDVLRHRPGRRCRDAAPQSLGTSAASGLLTSDVANISTSRIAPSGWRWAIEASFEVERHQLGDVRQNGVRAAHVCDARPLGVTKPVAVAGTDRTAAVRVASRRSCALTKMCRAASTVRQRNVVARSWMSTPGDFCRTRRRRGRCRRRGGLAAGCARPTSTSTFMRTRRRPRGAASARSVMSSVRHRVRR